jgi:hypothetical protein
VYLVIKYENDNDNDNYVRKTTKKCSNSKRHQNNILFNHLLKLRSSREVKSPILFGMEPVRSFWAIVFDNGR